MKKFLSLALVFATLTFALPKKEANAGVAIFVVGTPIGVILDNHEMAGLEGILIGGLVAIPGAILGALITVIHPATGLKIIKYSLVLDAEGYLPQAALENDLTHKYSFIDNQAVISDLAQTIKEKYELNKESNYVTLSETETRSILASANLNESEIAQVVKDLK